MAQAARGLNVNELRWPRAAGARTVLRVLTVARDQMSGELTRAVNALTALLRTVGLGIGARRAVTTTTITTVAAWRTRDENPTLAVGRTEVIRLARRIRALDSELAANHTVLHQAVTMQAPQLLGLPGVSAVVGATVLLDWSHPGRIRSEAAFAALAGALPLPALSGDTTRHRLSELSRQLTWSEQFVDLSHYRDQSRYEVDAVLENRSGHVVGIEVKAATTVRPEDFCGLRRLADRLDDDFIAGIVLYTGTSTLPFGDKLRALPVSALWQTPAPPAD